MSSLKVVLHKKAYKDGSYPLAIRITKNRTSAYTFIGHKIKKEFWDEKNQLVKKAHPNAKSLNNLIRTKLAESSHKLIDLEVAHNDFSAHSIISGIVGSKHATFEKQATLYKIALEKQGKFNRHSADAPRIKHFIDFLKHDKIGADISFTEISVALLNRYKDYLRTERKISERTIVNHLIVIRTIFNRVIGSNIVDRKFYPFGKGKIVLRFPESLKVGLTIEEVKAIEELVIQQRSVNHARNIWLFSFYFAGMRISDVLRLKWSDFQNDRLFYTMGKNAKPGSLKIPEKAYVILSTYNRENVVHDLVFPDLESLPNLKDQFEVQRRINQRVKAINTSLKTVATMANITKPLKTHIGRHTFGNLSGDKIPIQMLQKLYRHTSVLTTINYQSSFIHKDADDALDAVIGFY